MSTDSAIKYMVVKRTNDAEEARDEADEAPIIRSSNQRIVFQALGQLFGHKLVPFSRKVDLAKK